MHSKTVFIHKYIIDQDLCIILQDAHCIVQQSYIIVHHWWLKNRWIQSGLWYVSLCSQKIVFKVFKLCLDNQTLLNLPFFLYDFICNNYCPANIHKTHVTINLQVLFINACHCGSATSFFFVFIFINSLDLYQ